MHKLYKLFIFSVFVFISQQAIGQQRVLKMDSFRFDTDTIVYGRTINFSYHLTNISDSNLNYIGAITTWMKTNLESNPVQIQTDTIQVPIPNKTFRVINGSFTVTNPHFRENEKSIVVVWPTGTGNVRFENGPDSIQADVFVEENVSVKESENQLKYVRFYPNPSNGILHFETLNPVVYIKNMRLTDLQGKTIQLTYAGFNQNSLDMKNYRAGIYIIEVEFSNSEKARYRIIKSE